MRRVLVLSVLLAIGAVMGYRVSAQQQATLVQLISDEMKKKS